MNIIIKIQSLLNQGHERSIKAKKNILISLFLKGISILISLMIVPITLDYLNPEEYGVWLTLSSLLVWIGFFDIGLTSGLRNKLTESIATNDLEKGRTYVSTTFALLFLVILVFFIIYSTISPILDWSKILNTPNTPNNQLGEIVYITFSFFCLQFILKTVGTIYIAYQRSAVFDLMNVIASTISFLVIFLLTKITTHGSLLNVAIIFSAAPVIVFVVAYFITFFSQYRSLAPSFKAIDFRYTKNLMGLGIQFFIIQIACIIIFFSTNIIIAQLFGPELVTTYNIVFKYFSIVTMVFTIILTPLWNAYTEAFIRKDLDWMKNTLKRTFQIWAILVCGTIIMLIISPIIFKLWIGDKVSIPFPLSVACAFYVSILNWNNITSYFLNGSGKIKLQFYISILSSLIYIPITILLGNALGIQGILYSMSIVLILGAIIQPIQTYKIVYNKAKGIWNK